MGCTQSKTKEEQKDFTDLREAGPPAQSPERAPTNDAPAAKQHLENDDGEVIRGDAPVAKKRDKRFQFGGPLDECLAGDITACFKTGLLFRIVLQDTWYFYNDSSDYEMTVQFTYGPQSEVTPLDATRLAPAEGTDWPSLKLTVYPGETKRLMKGAFNGYKSKYNAVPLTPEYKQRLAEESEARLKKAIDAVKALGHFDTAEERLAACVKHGVPYVDLDFMPGTESLSKRDDTRQLAPTAWQRPTEFIPADQHSGIRVFKDSVEPNDIDQGQLGDCWFLCSVASVAEFPSKIKDMFKHPHGADVARQERLLGAYRVTYNKNGWWRIVIVDDYLPCVGNRPCFAKNDTDVAELWPALIEKGYAKLHGSYSSITGGDALHALQDLTGYPTSRFDTEWEDAVNDKKENGLGFFADLLRYDSSGYLINLNTPGVDNSAYMGSHGANNTKEFEERYKAAGLGMGHAYSVIAVKEFPKEGVHLLQIRNPWGNSTEWTGAWSDASDKWQQYPAIAKACDFKAASDGTFWMEWNDVKKYFDGGGVCFTKFDWFDYRVQGAWKSGAPNLVLEVTAHEDVEAFVVLSQNDRRGQPRGSVDAKYAAVMVSVCRPDAGQNRLKVHLSSTSDADKPKEGFTFLFARDVSVKFTFAANAKPYLIVPRMYDESIPNKDFVLGLITNKAVAAGKLSVKFRQLPADAPVFKNYMGFTYDPATAAVVNDRPYQFNPEVGAPITLRGAEIVPQ